MKLSVYVSHLRIMNDRDPAMAPLRFHDAVRGHQSADSRLVVDITVDGDGGEAVQETRLPAEGHYRPYSLYSIRVERTIFTGEADERLEITAGARAPDMEPGEAVSTYHRELTGDPQSWIGNYRPDPDAERTDELGPEHLGFWQIYYQVRAIGD